MKLNDAITQMRQFRDEGGRSFGIRFVTMHKPFVIRQFDRVVLRSESNTDKNRDLKLYFYDNDSRMPKECWRKLIIAVKFHGIWHDVSL